jgi:hypothetical protein
MTEQDYQSRYQEAFEELKARGVRVGEPFFTHDGLRVVRVSNFPYTDHAVFAEVWGKQTADSITGERGGTIRTSGLERLRDFKKF